MPSIFSDIDLTPVYADGVYIYETDNLEEALITFNGKRYPTHGNVVILAGGAASGKGFVKDTLLGIEGKVFDVDKLKDLVLKSGKGASSGVIRKRIETEFGYDLSKFDKSNPEDVSTLHDLVSRGLKLDTKRGVHSGAPLYAAILMSPPDKKPNLIFDVTLKNLDKLDDITRDVSKLGYEKRNIHIVWVVNDIEVAKVQNLNPDRGRVVKTEILVATHEGVSQTMKRILQLGDSLKTYMDGDIVFAFNKAGVDGQLLTHKSQKEIDGVDRSGSKIGMKGETKGGMAWIKTEGQYVYIKRSGKPSLTLDQISTEIRKKIKEYVPKNVEWL